MRWRKQLQNIILCHRTENDIIIIQQQALIKFFFFLYHKSTPHQCCTLGNGNKLPNQVSITDNYTHNYKLRIQLQTAYKYLKVSIRDYQPLDMSDIVNLNIPITTFSNTSELRKQTKKKFFILAWGLFETLTNRTSGQIEKKQKDYIYTCDKLYFVIN